MKPKSQQINNAKNKLGGWLLRHSFTIAGVRKYDRREDATLAERMDAMNQEARNRRPNQRPVNRQNQYHPY